MKLLSFFLGAVLVVMVKGQTACDYDYVCDDRNSLEDLKMEGNSPFACYKACQASVDPDGITKNCAYWTYYEELGYGRSFGEENDTVLDGVDGKLRANGKAVCRRLGSCDYKWNKDDCDSPGRDKCASGPGSCESCNICDPLTYVTGSTVAHWTCDIDFPYRKTDGVAEGTTCRTKCPSKLWADGNVAHASCKEDCTTGSKGIWELSAATPGVTDSSGTPVDPTIDPPCPCEDIVLGANQVPADLIDGSTLEVGAEFFCEAALIDSGSGLLDTMDTDSKCKLFCNGHVALDIKCIAGSWTAGVTSNDDIYCWGPPLECDYNPGVNSEVCTCAQTLDPAVNEICLPDQACNDGVCVAIICKPGDVATGDCFCQGLITGATCISGQTCNDDGTCT